jgi:hypothetical protein
VHVQPHLRVGRVPHARATGAHVGVIVVEALLLEVLQDACHLLVTQQLLCQRTNRVCPLLGLQRPRRPLWATCDGPVPALDTDWCARTAPRLRVAPLWRGVRPIAVLRVAIGRSSILGCAEKQGGHLRRRFFLHRQPNPLVHVPDLPSDKNVFF